MSKCSSSYVILTFETLLIQGQKSFSSDTDPAAAGAAAAASAAAARGSTVKAVVKTRTPAEAAEAAAAQAAAPAADTDSCFFLNWMTKLTKKKQKHLKSHQIE